MFEKHLKNEAETIAFGGLLGKMFCAGGRLYIKGDLGAGKTTLCRGILRKLGHNGPVKSPTFTLVEPYELSRHTIYHFDLYRLGDPSELEYIGIDDYFQAGNLCLVEWPERGGDLLPPQDLEITLTVIDRSRVIRLNPGSASGYKACQYCASAIEPGMRS